jgi:hypothetical protein
MWSSPKLKLEEMNPGYGRLFYEGPNLAHRTASNSWNEATPSVDWLTSTTMVPTPGLEKAIAS